MNYSAKLLVGYSRDNQSLDAFKVILKHVLPLEDGGVQLSAQVCHFHLREVKRGTHLGLDGSDR